MSKLTMLYHFKRMIDEAAEPLFSNRTVQKDAYVCLSGNVDGICKSIIKEYVEEQGLKIDSWKADREYDCWTKRNETVRVHLNFSNPEKQDVISLAEAEAILGKTIIVEG